MEQTSTNVLRFPVPPPPFSVAAVCPCYHCLTVYRADADEATAELEAHIRVAHPETVLGGAA